MAKILRVIAPKGLKCPVPHKRGAYYTDKEAVIVPDDMDHRRLVADGSLLIAPDDAPEPAKKTRPAAPAAGEEG